MHVLVRLENVRRLVQQVVEVLGHEEGGALVLLAREAHLVLQVEVVRLKQLVLLLRLRQLLFNLL